MYKYCKRLKTNVKLGERFTPLSFKINFMYLIILDFTTGKAYRTKFSKSEAESWTDGGEEAVHLLGFSPGNCEWMITPHPNVETL